MQVVRWNLEDPTGNPIRPEDPMPEMPDIPAATVVVLEGRAPIWRYGRAFHAVHGSAAAVATYDPRLGGAVIVASHLPGTAEGDLITLEENNAVL